MCQRNWRQYNASLQQRGSLSFFCDPKVVKLIKHAKKSSPNGGRPAYPLELVFVLCLLKISYGLTYRGCRGMALSIFAAHRVQIPCYTTICRGCRRLLQALPGLAKRRSGTLLIDSSGFKISGEGEWKTKIHGKSKRRSWVKVHIVVDSDTNEIVDLVVTPSNEADISVGLHLIDRMAPKPKVIMADGAYDGSRFRRKAYEHNVALLVPPPSTAKHQDRCESTERNHALALINALGGDKTARQLWGKLTGYCHRVKAESAFARLKSLFGQGLYSLNKRAQVVEVWLKALLSNIWISWN